MKKFHACLVLLATLAVLAGGPAAFGQEVAVAAADGAQEVPAIVTAGRAVIVASINDAGTQITYQVEYQNTQGTVLQAHLHIGQPGVNGGVMLFVCTNLGNGPSGTPACPNPGGKANGTWTVDSVIPVPNQGIGGGPFSLKRAINAMRSGIAYLNIHTDSHPAGEIRGDVTVLSAKEAAAMGFKLAGEGN